MYPRQLLALGAMQRAQQQVDGGAIRAEPQAGAAHGLGALHARQGGNARGQIGGQGRGIGTACAAGRA
ncbi:hypothetical protein, partial [Klebsiella quasipneumoniae]|uniref:hypothetical protein n=1 Tax=Klebsiella quasipneumoniae TaxID=1463165 RepID=UPI002730CE78